MPGILQEKYQFDYPQEGNDDSRSGWKTDQSARTKKGTPGAEPHHGPDPSTNSPGRASLPPGMDIEDQELSDQRQFATTMGGQSDVSKDWNAEALRNGFKRKEMRATDDEYSKAHQDAFYDEMEVDGNVGFSERNNMLDRL
jgi:hypothetical protein